MATTDGRDQVQLARAMWHLRNALLIKGVFVVIIIGVTIAVTTSAGAFGLVQLLGR